MCIHSGVYQSNIYLKVRIYYFLRAFFLILSLTFFQGRRLIMWCIYRGS